MLPSVLEIPPASSSAAPAALRPPARRTADERRAERRSLAWGPAAEVAAYILSVALVACADYATGSEIDLSLIYLFPVALATWRHSRGAGIGVSLASGAASVVADLTLGRYRLEPVFLLWNGGVQVSFFLVAVLAVDRIRGAERAERRLRASLEDAYRRLDQEMQTAGEVQHGLLPAAEPEVPGYAIAVHYATSVRAGGDYYDFLPLPGRRLGMLVADASGHGPAAAVIMASARVLVRNLSPEEGLAPEILLEVVNRRLAGNLRDADFVTACYAVLEPATGVVSFALAGHPRPILVRAAGGAAEDGVGAPGYPLGIDVDAQYARCEIALRPGDLLLLHTDGLEETLDPAGDPLGDGPVARCLEGARGSPPAAVLVRLQDVMRKHRGAAPVADDVTILAIRRDP